MSYMRGEHYVYIDGEDNIHINDVTMPLDKFDELVAMRLAQINPVQIVDIDHRAMDKWGGNFGCDELLRQYGKDTSLERMKKKMDQDHE